MYTYLCENIYHVAVCRQSKREYEAQQKQNRKENEDLEQVMRISQAEASRLEQASKVEQEKLSEVRLLWMFCTKV
jgi:hypothetical protein